VGLADAQDHALGVRADEDALVLPQVGAGVDAGPLAHADVRGVGDGQLDQLEVAGLGGGGDLQRGRVADGLRRQHDPVGAVLQHAEDDLRFLDVRGDRDVAALRPVRRGQHDLQWDLGRVAEEQDAPALLGGRVTGHVERVLVDDLHELAELDVRVRDRQLGGARVLLPDDHHVRAGEVPRQGALLQQQHLLDRGRQAVEVGDVGADHAVDPLVHGLFDDRLPGRGVVDGTQVEPTQFHFLLLTGLR
jgi:hypothetical protein